MKLKTLLLLLVLSLLLSFPLELAAQDSFQEYALAYHTKRRQFVSEALGVLQVDVPNTPLGNYHRAQVDNVRDALVGVAPPAAPLPLLRWDEALEVRASHEAQSCKDDPAVDDAPPNVAHFFFGSDAEDAAISLDGAMSAYGMPPCLNETNYGWAGSGNCKLGRLHLREDARAVGCGFHMCPGQKLSLACAYDVDDVPGVPWKTGATQEDLEVAQDIAFQTKVLDAFNISRDAVSVIMGVTAPDSRPRGLAAVTLASTTRNLQDELAKLPGGVPQLSKPLPPLVWDSALAGRALDLAKECNTAVRPENVQEDASVGYSVDRKYQPSLYVRSRATSNLAGCLDASNPNPRLFNHDSCHWARLVLREDASKVGCAHHACGDGLAFACVYDVSDNDQMPWGGSTTRVVAGADPAPVFQQPVVPSGDPFLDALRAAASDPNATAQERASAKLLLAEAEREAATEAAAKVKRAKAESEFEPGVLNDDVHAMINDAFRAAVEGFRKEVSTPRHVGLAFIGGEKAWKPSAVQEMLDTARENVRVEDGRDLFELLAAKGPFPPVKVSPSLVEQAKKRALTCKPSENQLQTDLGNGYLGMWDISNPGNRFRALGRDPDTGNFVDITPDPAGMVLLTQRVMADHIANYVGALAMIGRGHSYVSNEALADHAVFLREYEEGLYLAPGWVYRGMLSPKFIEFGCGIAECELGTFGVACIIPKVEWSPSLHRTPYPSSWNDDPPANWRKKLAVQHSYR